MTEAELQTAVVEMARWLGFKFVYHTWLSKNSTPGFPDLVLVSVKQRRTLFVELKGERGAMSPPQLAWYAALLEAGNEVYVWKPEDYKDGAIERILREGPDPVQLVRPPDLGASDRPVLRGTLGPPRRVRGGEPRRPDVEGSDSEEKVEGKEEE